MVPELRRKFNEFFTEDRYQIFLHDMEANLQREIGFRVAESPIFVSTELKEKLLSASEEIVDVITRPDFKALTEKAIPEQWKVPGENGHPHFIAFDFGICKNDSGELVPKLIEMQGFPTLFCFQAFVGENYKKHFPIPENYSIFLNGYNKEKYLQSLRRIIIGDTLPGEAVLMDLHPHLQKTKIDFYITSEWLGIPVVGFEELLAEGNKLFYMRDGKRQRIKRIFNRLIFDDLEASGEQPTLDLTKPYDVEWITHPNWFYRISKYTMPFLKSQFIPETRFLIDVKEIPADLENYVLKPLFSFSGMGVIIDVTPEDIKKVKDPENWILQRKVSYEPALQSPEGGVKMEIRMIYFWEDGQARPTAVCNLSRMSRGKMIGVRYNKDLTWVGGNISFFEQ